LSGNAAWLVRSGSCFAHPGKPGPDLEVDISLGTLEDAFLAQPSADWSAAAMQSLQEG